MIASTDKDRENHSVIQHYLGMTMNQMRHLEVSRLIQEYKVTKIADFGCSQGSLIQRLARSQTIQLLIGMDIDDVAVMQTVSNVMPQNLQESIQFSREMDQHIIIYKGDMSKKYLKIKEFEVELITLVDVIQHLLPEFIQSTVDNVFSFLKPKYCFISTPNQEFNAHFNIEKGKYRHWDHKFEWTQAEFESFCIKVSNQYHYSYQIKGIGAHINDSTKGYCTQYAIFIRDQDYKGVQIEKPQIQSIQTERPQAQSIQTEKLQIQSIQTDLQQKGRFMNKSWQNNKPNIMLNLLYKSLFYREDISWEQAKEFMEKECFGVCLKRNNIPINRQFFIEYLSLFSDRFVWDEEKYMLKQIEESSSQSSSESEEMQDFIDSRMDQQLPDNFFSWS